MHSVIILVRRANAWYTIWVNLGGIAIIPTVVGWIFSMASNEIIGRNMTCVAETVMHCQCSIWYSPHRRWTQDIEVVGKVDGKVSWAPIWRYRLTTMYRARSTHHSSPTMTASPLEYLLLSA